MDQLEMRDRGIGREEGVNHEKIEVNGREDSHRGTESTEDTESAKILNPPCPPCLREMSSDKITDTVLRELAAIDPNAVTPLEALALVSEWKLRLAGGAKPRAGKKPGGKDADSTPSLFKGIL
jgi:hypothetical protein